NPLHVVERHPRDEREVARHQRQHARREKAEQPRRERDGDADVVQLVWLRAGATSGGGGGIRARNSSPVRRSGSCPSPERRATPRTTASTVTRGASASTCMSNSH